MTFDGFKIDLNSRSEAEVCVTAGQLSKNTAENVTIEDKITELFDALCSSILSYLVAVFGFVTAAEAEDITQDAFLQLHRMMQKGNQIDNTASVAFPRVWFVLAGLSGDDQKIDEALVPF